MVVIILEYKNIGVLLSEYSLCLYLSKSAVMWRTLMPTLYDSLACYMYLLTQCLAIL